MPAILLVSGLPLLFLKRMASKRRFVSTLSLLRNMQRPVVVVGIWKSGITLPFTILTFGLFLLVVNALILWLVAVLVPGIRIQGFGSALLGSLVLTLLNLAVELFI